MQKFLTVVSLLFLVKSYGQNDFRGQILSIVDSTPIPHFSLKVDNKELVKTDSLGFFSLSGSKSKIKLTTIFDLHGFDTIINITTRKSIELYSVQIFDSTLAKHDLKHGQVFLFCGVAFAPMAFMQSDKEFEKKYHVQYYIVGDFLPSSIAQMRSYNLIVAGYLDKRFGVDWRAEIRRDALGITKTVNN